MVPGEGCKGRGGEEGAIVMRDREEIMLLYQYFANCLDNTKIEAIIKQVTIHGL